jgi:hypothetical protein
MISSHTEYLRLVRRCFASAFISSMTDRALRIKSILRARSEFSASKTSFTCAVAASLPFARRIASPPIPTSAVGKTRTSTSPIWGCAPFVTQSWKAGDTVTGCGSGAGLRRARLPRWSCPTRCAAGDRRDPVGADDLGRGADQVGDDRVEPLVDLGLRGVAQVHGLGVCERAERARLVILGDGARGFPETLAGLLDQNRAVPGECRGLEQGGAVLGVVLLGDAAADRVVAVSPGLLLERHRRASVRC